MASRVLLISANRCEMPDPVFPLGLAYLSAALRQAGHTCAWHDCLVDRGSLEKTIGEFRPDYVGISLRNIDDVKACPRLKCQRHFLGMHFTHPIGTVTFERRRLCLRWL